MPRVWTVGCAVRTGDSARGWCAGRTLRMNSCRQPLEGACEGQMACSTCHVIVAKEDFSRLPHATEEEDDLLDLAWAVRPTSRLACQINLTDELETLTVQMPGGAYNLDR